MVTRTLRAYVELAAGLGEVTRARAVEAAQEIISFAGSDPSPKQVAAQVTRLADDLLTAAEHNRDQVVALVQREVDAAVARLDAGRLLGEVQSLGATVAGLAAQVDELARAAGMRAGRAPSTGRADVVEPALATPPALDLSAPAAPRRASTARSTATTSSATKKASPEKAAAKKSTAKKFSSTAKKSTAKKSTAKKTTAAGAKKASATKKSSATQASAQKSGAKKSTAKKSSSTTKKSTAKRTPAKKTSTATKNAASTSTPSGSGSGSGS